MHTRRILCTVGMMAWLVGLVGQSAFASVQEMPPLGARSMEHVLLVVNTSHPWSARVVERYAEARGVPDDHVVRVTVPSDPIVPRDVYLRDVEFPIVTWLREHEAFDRTTIILLGPGVPLRIAGTGGRNGTTASVDTELAVLYRRLTGATTPLTGFVANPYFTDRPLTEPRPFTRAGYDIYLVTRIDGRTEDEALALIERGGRRPERFRVVVDGRPPQVSGPEGRWLTDVEPRVKSAAPSAEVIVDATAAVISGERDVTGYAGWGSNDSRLRVPDLTFGPGAIASSFMSSDARTLASPPASWKPGTWEDRATYFGGTPEALAADWLAAGLTGLGAQVSEPFLDGAFRPATLFEAWARGYTLAESFYLALPYLSWQGVVFGDPLARAADPSTPAPEPSEEGLASFIERSAVAFRTQAPELDLESARLMVRANLAIGRKDAAEAASLFEQVTVRAPGYATAHSLLGQQYDTLGRYDLARARYRYVLELEPANVVALNNLAYNLAIHDNDPTEALPLAERAAALAGRSPAVLDTLGWIRHLTGDSQGAATLLRQVVAAQPGLCEAWTHLAAVEQAIGATGAAAEAARRAEACGAK